MTKDNGIANPQQLAKTASPSEIARDTIKRMASERIMPTPENYLRIYNQIAQIPDQINVEDLIKGMLKDLPVESTESMKWAGALEKILYEANPGALSHLVQGSIQAKSTQSKAWPSAIRDLLAQWEKKTSVSAQYKKDTLDRLLNNFGADPSLPEKLQAMTKTWMNASLPATDSVNLTAESGLIDPVLPSAQPQSINMVSQGMLDKAVDVASHDYEQNVMILQDMLKQALSHGLIPRLEGYEDLKDDVTALFNRIAKTSNALEWQAFSDELNALLNKVDGVSHDETDLKNSLLNLLRLLIDNIAELMLDDKSMNGQIAALKTILSSPLEKGMIADVEKSLKEVIHQQSVLKSSLLDTRESFKSMVSVFIERLSHLAESTDAYQEKIGVYAEKLAGLDDIVQINALVESLAADTRDMQSDILKSHHAIDEQRLMAVSAETKIRELEVQLSQLSEKVRIDQLTGVLNRRGLEEAFVQEIARAQRGESTLCVAMLDIDNFKRLNDSFGHEVGDMALKMLANVVKDTVRPTDVVARFGGEEFVILLPETDLKHATAAVVRLQRELTKKFFMQKNERVLITFSAGIASFKAEEEQATVLHRADSAMYLAKKMGKNRVMTEQDL